jgi:predicted transposase YbfD/YdcC
VVVERPIRAIDHKVSAERGKFLYVFACLENFIRVVRVYQGTEHQHNRLLEINFEEDKKRTRINRALDNLAIKNKKVLNFYTA